jgi:asparagine synthetase B (glutamine-hydrolysing)
MISQYLKYGSVFDVEYEEPDKYVDISLDEAVERHLALLELPNGYRLASSGGLDSSIIWCLKPYDAFCVSSIGNSDIKYARMLNPEVDDIKFDVDLEYEITQTMSLWDKPHCGKTDPYDHFVYRQHTNIITGEELYHLDASNIMNRKGDYIDRFTDTVEIFTDREIYELGLNPYRIELRSNSIYHLEYFIYDCWTKISRKIFFHFDRVISPFLTEKFIKFYKLLPMTLKVHKNLQRAVGEKVVPKFIYDREKNYHTNGPNEQFMEAYREQYQNLVNKYLKDSSREIFKIVSYQSVQKHLNHYRKMWCLLNLSVWLEMRK